MALAVPGREAVDTHGGTRGQDTHDADTIDLARVRRERTRQFVEEIIGLRVRDKHAGDMSNMNTHKIKWEILSRLILTRATRGGLRVYLHAAAHHPSQGTLRWYELRGLPRVVTSGLEERGGSRTSMYEVYGKV